jgi:hypothetical protein
MVNRSGGRVTPSDKGKELRFVGENVFFQKDVKRFVRVVARRRNVQFRNRITSINNSVNVTDKKGKKN